MKAYLLFALKRFIQLIAVVVFGCSIAFLVAHLSPISPVDTIIMQVTGRSASSPEAIKALRETLTELFGLVPGGYNGPALNRDGVFGLVGAVLD
jgi:peptide/nickel transport system permease protein